MEKIFLVINARQPQLSPVNFACRIAALSQSSLTGLFVENLYQREEAPSAGGSYFRKFSEKNAGAAVKTDTDHAINLFKRECALHHVEATVLVNRGEPIQEVLRESRYADLLIMDPGIGFYNDDEQSPSHFTKEILANAECPVLLAPEKVTDIDEVVFCFDESASAVFAIKQFTYLFPGFRSTKARMLQVKRFSAEGDNGDHQRMVEWLRAHYDQVTEKTLSGHAGDELFAWFFLKEKRLVVMGSYGRSALSGFFRRSAADSLIQAVDLPVFITHFSR